MNVRLKRSFNLNATFNIHTHTHTHTYTHTYIYIDRKIYPISMVHNFIIQYNRVCRGRYERMYVRLCMVHK